MSFSDPSALSFPPFLRRVSSLFAGSANLPKSKSPAQVLTEEEAFLAESSDAADCERRQRLLARHHDLMRGNRFL
jgi:hypothetical protein